MTDYITEFKDALAAAGYATDSDIKADDRLNRAHRVGDKGGKNDIRYRLALDGGFAYGWFIYQGGERHDWHSKGQQLTASEAAAQKAKVDAQRRASNAARQEAGRAAAKRAEYIWSHATPAPADHPYLARKGIQPGQCRVSKGVLVVPMYNAENVLCSLQFISATGAKRYLKDGAKGTVTLRGDSTLALCEGYATGDTIHRATGWTVEVCFDTAMLKTRAGKVEANVVCADNDQWVFRMGKRPAELGDDKSFWPAGDAPEWTEWRKNGLLFNPGFEAATAALKKAGGSARLVNPKFKNAASRPTDFNDLEAAEGLDAVKVQLLAAPLPDDECPPNSDYVPPDMDDMARMEGIPVYDPESVTAPIESGPFKIMGYDQGLYYYLPRASGQLVGLSAGGHNKNNLMQLAPLEWWAERFGTRSGKISWDHATNALMQMCHVRRVFKVDTMIRGSGVWVDKGRIIAHCGDRLIVDGEEVEPFEVGSAYVYQKSGRIYDIAKDPLEDVEAAKLLKIFQLLNWRNPMSAILAAGWTTIAPLAGALKWRPHIYIDGEKGSGKSWVNDEVIKPALGRCAIRLGSGTTEAGLRRLIGNDARPIVMDEMEGEDKKQKEIRQAILLMARKASSGESMVIADSAGRGMMVFKIYSMFSMSSINTGVVQGADLSRFSHLELMKNNSADAVAEFRDIQAFVKETLTEQYSARLLRRTLNNARTIIKNSLTFSEAAAVILKDRRAGDQIGPMLAGAFSLHSTHDISMDGAIKWIREKDWESYTAINEKPDHEKMFDHLQTARLVISGASKKIETQIGQAISVALGYADDNYTSAEARHALQSIDIKVRQDDVWIRKPSQHMNRILRETPWETSWHASFVKINGIGMSKSPQSFGSSSAIVIMIPKEKFRPEGIML